MDESLEWREEIGRRGDYIYGIGQRCWKNCVIFRLDCVIFLFIASFPEIIASFFCFMRIFPINTFRPLGQSLLNQPYSINSERLIYLCISLI